MPLILITSLEYRLGLTRDMCPTCGTHLPARVVVSAATVVDVTSAWLEDGEENYEEIPIVCIEMSRTAPPKEPLTEPRAGQP